MGHLVGKDLFRELGRKIDALEVRTPWNSGLHALLKELYTEEEADVVIKMPYRATSLERLERISGYESARLRGILDGLADKGLVIDINVRGSYYYTPSPMVIGIFEYTMMRTGPQAKTKEWAQLLRDYMEGDSFLKANLGHGERYSVFRALPHEEAFEASEYVEVLDYEKVSSLLAGSQRFAIGLCSCRHEKLHLGEKRCQVPLESCSQFGKAADFMIRHKLAREVSRSEMEENFARSRELGLVLTADNVQRNMKFVCHCCSCCCLVLRAVSKHGYPNLLVTSNYLSQINYDDCIGCGKCAAACPIEAVSPLAVEKGDGKPKRPQVDGETCLGCGVCALKCPRGACRLVRRGQRVIHPESSFERIMLQCLEKGTLQNQMFPDPGALDQKFMRTFVGAFLRLPPVKRAFLGDSLRSRFLSALKKMSH